MNYKHPATEARKALIDAFLGWLGAKVRVTRGRGTGYGWVHVHIEVPQPTYCCCAKGAIQTCDICRGAIRFAREQAVAAVSKVKFHQYYPDDGYNQPHDEVLFYIHIKRPNT